MSADYAKRFVARSRAQRDRFVLALGRAKEEQTRLLRRFIDENVDTVESAVVALHDHGEIEG